MIITDTDAICEVCGQPYMGDGHQWTCDNCLHREPCGCGYDAPILDWYVIPEMNTTGWKVVCECGKETVFWQSAKEAAAAWTRGERYTPIAGTDHYEEAW